MTPFVIDNKEGIRAVGRMGGDLNFELIKRRWLVCFLFESGKVVVLRSNWVSI